MSLCGGVVPHLPFGHASVPHVADPAEDRFGAAPGGGFAVFASLLDSRSASMLRLARAFVSTDASS